MSENFNIDLIISFLQTVAPAKYYLYPRINTEDIRVYQLRLLADSFKNGKLFISEGNSGIEAIVSFRPLEWDSTHFGYKCAVIDQYYYNQSIEQNRLISVFNQLIYDILHFARNENIKFISISINSWDSILSRILQANNFNYILTWIDGIYLPNGKLQIPFRDHEIGLIRESEVEIYQRISENCYFEGGRFYLDKNFDRSRVKKMYSELIVSSYVNNEILLSYRINSEPVGLFVCKKILEIGNQKAFRIAPLRFLIIRNDKRKAHIGQSLFVGTLNYLMDRCDIITTGLEVHNLPSLNLHSKLHFKFNYTHNIFHWWA